LFTEDRITFALGIFGRNCPSISYGRAKTDHKFNIPSLNSADPNLTTDAAGNRPLPYLPVKRGARASALPEWKQVLTLGTLKFPIAPKKSPGFTDQSIVELQIGGLGFIPFYSKLKQAVHNAKAAMASSTGVRPGGADLGGNKAKKRRQGGAQAAAVGSLI
jgi:hypothetical protein